MALKGLDIFKLSPKKNCKECGSPTCMAFCMKVAQGAVELSKCPYFSEDAIAKLRASGLDKVVCEEAKNGKPLLGICLGMQLLFEKSYEFGEFEGLGLIEGAVRPIADVIPKDYKIPHIGWNALHLVGEKSPIFRYLNEGDHVYFVHSYYAADCEKNVIGTSEYGAELTAAVQKDNIFGCQFHPEKSGAVGLSILKAFAEL